MKKLLIFTLFIFLVIVSRAQDYSKENINVLFGMGLSVTNLDVGNASPVGMAFDIDVFNVHMDVATNMAKGKGEYLAFSSSQTSKSNKQSWVSLNFGYDFEIKNKWYIVPKAGCVVIEDIWEDPISWNTYYSESAGTKFQVGVELKKKFKNMYVKASSCTTEIFSSCIGLTF